MLDWHSCQICYYYYSFTNQLETLSICIHTICLESRVYILAYDFDRHLIPVLLDASLTSVCHSIVSVQAYATVLFLYTTSEPRQANLCLRAFRHDKF